ncbi:MAG: beta-lactamase family protein [Anaeromicrobium sp.]|jgi:CubicO group peptidase (beta-lactamase class C family)|uniref:serine hydrolase domain-containing protein n=1 Tax=Anaeromicrobium sp. TaxID=1929132 RepID=UPI0025D65C96|nr:serine hydrolase [Anaeromicrobium sp.]MCT4595870.1 beta-lactamase family protein [Anaeromicrobium sp.]
MFHELGNEELLPKNSYIGRYLTYGIKNRFKQTIEDYKYFPCTTIKSPSSHFKFEDLGNKNIIDTYKVNDTSFRELLLSSKTTAFLVIKNDNIICENYFNGYQREMIHRLYSVTKSISSALIGIAIEEGFIDSIDDPITKYITELKSNFNEITIEHLLNMESGIEFKEGYFPWKDEIKTYFSSDCRTLLAGIKIKDKIGDFFHYNDYHPLLLSLLLERTLNMPIAEFLEKKIWYPLGMEFPASITLDNIKNGLAKLESGLTCTAIDLAKFGRLFLNQGNWNGNQIINKKWVIDSTGFNGLNQPKEYFTYYNKHPWGNWFATGKGYYKYFWWGYKVNEIDFDYFAMGILGQILYISPRENTVVIRLGKEWGIKGWWPTIIKDFIDNNV